RGGFLGKRAQPSASSPGCAKTPKWHFGRTKKGFSDPSPPKKTRHIETVEVVFPGSPAGEEFSHSLSRRRLQFSRRALRLISKPSHTTAEWVRRPRSVIFPG